MKRLMSGVRNMSVNQKVSDKIKLQFALITEDADISVVEQMELSLLVRVENHVPLDLVHINYICHSYLWSKNYNPVYECRVSGGMVGSMPDFDISYKYRHKSCLFVASDSANAAAVRLCEQMNHNVMLLRLLEQTDIISLGLEKRKPDFIELKISPFGGMITKFLIPPVTYYVKPDRTEMIRLFQVIQLMITEIERII